MGACVRMCLLLALYVSLYRLNWVPREVITMSILLPANKWPALILLLRILSQLSEMILRSRGIYMQLLTVILSPDLHFEGDLRTDFYLCFQFCCWKYCCGDEGFKVRLTFQPTKSRTQSEIVFNGFLKWKSSVTFLISNSTSVASYLSGVLFIFMRNIRALQLHKICCSKNAMKPGWYFLPAFSLNRVFPKDWFRHASILLIKII